jgi:hypothetical protein
VTQFLCFSDGVLAELIEAASEEGLSYFVQDSSVHVEDASLEFKELATELGATML